MGIDRPRACLRAGVAALALCCVGWAAECGPAMYLPCPRLTLTIDKPDAIALTVDDGKQQLSVATGCTAVLSAEETFVNQDHPRDVTISSLMLDLSCPDSGGRSPVKLTLRLGALGDPRSWKVGTRDVQAAVKLHYREFDGIGPSSGAVCVSQALEPTHGVRLEVLETKGLELAYPKLVQPAFERRFRLRSIGTPAALGGEKTEPQAPCERTLTLAFDLELTLAPTHFSTDQTNVCRQ